MAEFEKAGSHVDEQGVLRSARVDCRVRACGELRYYILSYDFIAICSPYTLRTVRKPPQRYT
jgi:hypothetical protein